MFPAEAEPLPAAAFHPPAWPEDLLDPPPPQLHPSPWGGGTFRASSNRGTPLGSLRPRCFPPDPPPDPGEWVEPLLRSTPVTAPGLRMGGGSVGAVLRSRGPLLPSGPGSEPLHPAPSSRDAGVRGATWGDSWTHARFSRRDEGPVEWWAVPSVYRRARFACRWRWVLQRRGEGLMPTGAVWLGPLEWPEPVPRLQRQRSVGVLARRSRRRRARRPPAWLTLRSWLPGPEDLFDPPRDPITQSELWDGGGCGDSDDPLFLEFLRACTPHLGWLSAELRVTPRVLVKRLTLFVDRVFDTADAFRLPTAAHNLVKAVKSLRREDCPWCAFETQCCSGQIVPVF